MISTNSECVFVALVVQLAKRMRIIVLSSVVWLAVPHFSTLSHELARLSGRKNY